MDHAKETLFLFASANIVGHEAHNYLVFCAAVALFYTSLVTKPDIRT